MISKHIVLQCKSCGAVLVINKKDFWHHIRCTLCDSTNIANVDEVNVNEIALYKIDEIGE